MGYLTKKEQYPQEILNVRKSIEVEHRSHEPVRYSASGVPITRKNNDRKTHS